MLKNFPLSKTATVLKTMEESPVEFHLQGSQLFGGADEHSDIDFFCGPVSGGVMAMMGFFLIETRTPRKSPYLDILTQSVWKHQEANIHVSVVVNLQVKIAAVRFFQLYREHYPDKWITSPPEVTDRWNMVYRALQYGQQLPKFSTR